MRISARADHAVRAVVELAVRQGEGPLGDLRRGGVVASRRGGGGGFRLAREAGEITVADVIRALDGPIVSVRGERPTGLAHSGTAEPVERPAAEPAAWENP
ncbi:Rrf2 family transcriptional regulator [Streptomyces sp. NPDC007991]|uniref:Rrf2 family transcriptional regulator n=1 Tax=Streptomyces sp. NPDC007991 TaxID=3364803 RepID=UPI0036E71569